VDDKGFFLRSDVNGDEFMRSARACQRIVEA